MVLADTHPQMGTDEFFKRACGCFSFSPSLSKFVWGSDRFYVMDPLTLKVDKLESPSENDAPLSQHRRPELPVAFFDVCSNLLLVSFCH